MGLMSLPIDGNPYRYMGVIIHPGDIKNIKSAQSVKFLFTTGRSDYTINIWKHNPNPSIEVVQSGGEGIEPFLNLLEGRDGLNIKKWLIIPIIHKLNLKMKILLNKEFRSNSYSEFNSCYAC
jgi:WD40 repeat protein